MLSGIVDVICGALKRLDGRRLIAGPRFACAIACLSASGAFIAQVEANPAWLAWPAVLGLLLAALARARLLAIFLTLVPLIFWGYASLRTGERSDDISQLPLSRACLLRAEVISLAPSSSPSVTRALVAPYQVLFPANRGVSGLTMLTIRNAAGSMAEGDRIEAKARLLPPAEKQYPWEFDTRAYFWRRGVHSLAVANGSEVKLLGTVADSKSGTAAEGHDLGKWFRQTLDNTRSRLISVHRRNVGGIEADLLSAMVLGDRAVSLAPEVKDRFRDAGLSHVLAASGFNLTIVVAMTWWVGRWIVRFPLAVNGLSFLSMLLFVCLAGPSPSVIRAALMCSLVLMGRCLFRSSSVTATLAVALLVTLLLDPSSIVDVGLQLSYVATFGIVCGAQALASWMTPVRPLAVLRWFAEAVAVVLVAQFSILPLQLTYFFQVGVLFLPANLLVALAVPIATALGFVSSALVLNQATGALLAPIAACLDWIASYPVRWILFIVDFISRVESSQLTLGPPPLAASILYYAAFLIFLLCLRKRSYRQVSLSLLLVAFVALLWRSPLPPLTLAAFPGATIIIDTNRQAVCLGDCSGKSVARFLSYNGVKPVPGSADNFKVRVSGVWTTVESVSPPASILVGSPGTQWQPPDTIPPRLAALVILRKHSSSTRKRATSNLYRAAWDFASENRADWLVFDSPSWRRSRPTLRHTPRAAANVPSVAFLGAQALVLTSSGDEPGLLCPYTP